MLSYGPGCYETVFRVADGISPSAAESPDLPTLWNVFVRILGELRTGRKLSVRPSDWYRHIVFTDSLSLA